MHLDKVKAVNSELQPQQEVMQLQLAVDRLHLVQVHCHGLPLEELVCHSQVPLQEEGGEEEEAQAGEAEANNLSPASQTEAYWVLPGPGPFGSIFTDFTGPYLALLGLT